MEAIQGIALRGYRLENIHVGYKRDLADIPPVIEEKNIRPYKSEDRNSLLNLDKQTFPSMNLEPAELTSWQERGEGVILVSPGEGGLNGFVILEIYGEKMQYCFVRSLAVAPEARGEGLGNLNSRQIITMFEDQPPNFPRYAVVA